MMGKMSQLIEGELLSEYVTSATARGAHQGERTYSLFTGLQYSLYKPSKNKDMCSFGRGCLGRLPLGSLKYSFFVCPGELNRNHQSPRPRGFHEELEPMRHDGHTLASACATEPPARGVVPNTLNKTGYHESVFSARSGVCSCLCITTA